MGINRKFYPEIWDAMRQQELERVGYRCEDCGVLDGTTLYNPNKPHPFYPEGSPWTAHLQLTHRDQYQTWMWEADTRMLCLPCHSRFDAKVKKKVLPKQEPVGYVLAWVFYRGKWTLAASVRSCDEVVRVVHAAPVGTDFKFQFEMFLSTVGHGRYRKDADGLVVLREVGACRGLGAYIQPFCSASVERVQQSQIVVRIGEERE